MFSVVSFYPQGGGSHVTITHDVLDVTIQPPPPVQGPGPTPSASDIWWPRLETYVKLVHLRTTPGADIWWLATVAHTVVE